MAVGTEGGSDVLLQQCPAAGRVERENIRHRVHLLLHERRAGRQVGRLGARASVSAPAPQVLDLGLVSPLTRNRVNLDS